MQGITKGTVLGDRYDLTSEISDAPGLARWIARDEKLGRDIAITVFSSDSAHAEAALDSARRAAGVEDARLVRVLDAGRDKAFAYVVEEAHTGAHTLADLVRFEPMHPEEARRIVGETAAALEAARQRGLHHLILGPRHVLRLADGSIAVTQVAVAGALAGHDDMSSAEATKADAKALVNLLYLGLTGLWAGPERDIAGLKGIETVTRRADGQAPTPGELLDDVPGDLDTMCRQSLNEDLGPKTPGEVARQLAPWSAQMITTPGKPRRSVPKAETAQASKRDDDTDPGYTVRRARENERAQEEKTRRKGVGAVGAAALAAAGASAVKVSTNDGERRKGNADATDPRLGASARLPRKPTVRPATASVSRPDVADATMVGRPAQFDADETTQFSVDDEDSVYAHTNYDPSFEELDPPVPGFHGGTEDPDPKSSRLALGIVAVVVLVALVLAVMGLKGLTSSGGDDKAPSEAGSTSSRAPSTSGAAAPSSTSAAGAAKPVKILGASFINKRGVRQADSRSVNQAVDGDPSTEWQSLHYLGQSWGGYKSFGGIAVNLGTSTDVKTVKITPGKDLPLTADVYVGDVPGTTGTKIGSVSNATSEQTVSGSANGRYVTIFIPTQQQAPGQTYYQAAIAEVSVEQ